MGKVFGWNRKQSREMLLRGVMEKIVSMALWGVLIVLTAWVIYVWVAKWLIGKGK